MHYMIQVVFLPSYFGLPIINTVSIHQMGHCQMAPRGDVCVGGGGDQKPTVTRNSSVGNRLYNILSYKLGS